MAFGTGHHETTRGCLSLLDRHLRPCPRALDFGSGTGILSIAMCLLGAKFVVAVERDPLAREATRANAKRNRVAGRLRVRSCLADAVGPFDAIAANVDAVTLRRSAKALGEHAPAGALLVASGIWRDQGPAVRAALGREWREVDAIEDGEWTTLALVRRR